MHVQVITAPTTYPVSRTEAKLHCRVDGADEDTLIDGLIAAANDYVERYTGRSFATQTLRLTHDDFADDLQLPRGPVQSVTHIKYDDIAGVEQTLSTDYYTLDNVGHPAWIVLNNGYDWPEVLDGINTVRVTYVAGYTTVPAPVKLAMLLLIGLWYDNRTAASDRPMVEVPHAVDALLCNYRTFGF